MQTLDLTPQKALIFRVTHVDNLPSILRHGLVCQAVGSDEQPFVAIGKGDLIEKRAKRQISVSPHGTLSDYVPFYFTPVTPMMLNIVTGRGVPKRDRRELIVLVSSLPRVAKCGVRFIYSDRHAIQVAAVFTAGDDLSKLTGLPWNALRTMSFRRNLDDPESFERYMAEALIYRCLPVEGLIGAGVHDVDTATAVKGVIARHSIDLRVEVRERWFC